MKSIFHIAAMAAVSVFAVSCMKDPMLDDMSWSGDECSLSMDVGFTAFGTALDTRATGGTPGDAIGEVYNMQVLFYSNEGTDNSEENAELKYVFTGTPTDGGEGSGSVGESETGRVYSGTFTFTRTDENRTSYDGPTPETGISGTSTRHMTFRLGNVERGRYRIYVVANMPAEFIATRDANTVNALRNYKLNWNADNIAANNAMFGYFTSASASQVDVINSEAPQIAISGPLSQSQALHAWIKRAVSKVTVAFDGSNLEPEVRVYIKSVQIRDLPRKCSLGAINSPGEADGEPATVLFPDTNNANEMKQLTDHATITYSSISGEDPANVVYREEPYYPGFNGDTENGGDVSNWKKNVHSATTNALYFFENCQGTGEHTDGDGDPTGTYKPQTDETGGEDGGPNKLPDDYDHDNFQKDNKLYGTYVEVHAYYENDNLDNRTSGNIIYRFMLGKDIYTDFNAERSIHYKLTLKFNGYANDVDWHIDYNDEPGDHTPETIYVSYNYNTPSILPFQFVGDKPVEYLEAEITQNNWGPDNQSISHFTGTPTATGLGVGFLSLRYDPNVRIGTGVEGEEKESGKRGEDAPRVPRYWDKYSTNAKQIYLEDGKQSSRLNLNEDSIDDKYKFNYKVRQNSDKQYVTSVNIPLYTRPLMIYKSTSYTGANPYYTTTRSAKVLITYQLEGESTKKTREVNIEQVHRIDNPSGIWRRSDNTEKFDVILMQQTGDEAYRTAGVAINRSYTPYKSKGSWRAYIYKATGTDGKTEDAWFTLTAGNQRADAIGEYIQGLNGTNISFTYKPTSPIDAKQVRCGIIKIEYNDYTCTHMILVRQGYESLKISDADDAPKWHTFNLYDNNEEVNHPCDAGSLFVRGRYTPSIRDDQSPDNTGNLSHSNNLFGTAVPNLYTTTGDTYPITNNSAITGQGGNNFSSSVVNLNENNVLYNPSNDGYMPTYLQYRTLKDESTRATIDKLYGVLYADGATETATDFYTATGCLHIDVVNGKTKKGMRGAFAYNSDDARQVFFPIGATGFGRRKYNTTNGTGRGALQYGFGDTYDSGNYKWESAPLLNNLFSNEGAIYWMQAYAMQKQTGSTHTEGDNGWDVNYKTYDFDFMDADDHQNARSLSLIRLVDNN